MRFLPSISLLTLAATGLATPVAQEQDAPRRRAPLASLDLPVPGLGGASAASILKNVKREAKPQDLTGWTGAPRSEKPSSKRDVVNFDHDGWPFGPYGLDGLPDEEGRKTKRDDVEQRDDVEERDEIEERGQTCLTKKSADDLVNKYAAIIGGWKPEYADWLAKSFYDRSDSINTLAGIPLGSYTFPNKTAFVGYQTYTPDNLPLYITHRFGPFNCTNTGLIWYAENGPKPEPKPVRGIAILGGYKNRTIDQWQLKSIEVEFNNIIYLENIYGTWARPNTTA